MNPTPQSICEAAGVVCKETLFRRAPLTSYAVWFDTIAEDGGDLENLYRTHDATIELYDHKTTDTEAVQAITSELSDRGIKYTRQERVAVDDEELFMTVFEYEYQEMILSKEETQNGNA